MPHIDEHDERIKNNGERDDGKGISPSEYPGHQALGATTLELFESLDRLNP